MIEVPLTRGKVALIDDTDTDLVLAHTWSASNPGHPGTLGEHLNGSDEGHGLMGGAGPFTPVYMCVHSGPDLGPRHN